MVEDVKYSEPKVYDKLVRDGVVDHIQSLGKEAIFHVASPEEKYSRAMEKLREELGELKEAIQTMEKVQTESGANPKIFEARKKDVHYEMADVLEIKNMIIENFTGNMPTEGRQELNALDNYLKSIVLQYNLDIMKTLNIQSQKKAEKGGYGRWIILEKS